MKRLLLRACLKCPGARLCRPRPTAAHPEFRAFEDLPCAAAGLRHSRAPFFIRAVIGCLGLGLLAAEAVAADALYLNTGSVNTPQVDAITFINKGLFQASSSIPYETQDTLYFTNTVGTFAGSGTMIGSPGFRFNTDSSVNGTRTM